MDTLLVIVGPTGVGKTELCLRLAEHYGCPIVNADSRQIYREIPIGTAAPTAAEQARARHYFVGTHSLREDYNAGAYERDAVVLLTSLMEEASRKGNAEDKQPFAILSGGSMMYIDAVCRGLDDIPSATPELRARLQEQYRQQGITWLQQEVERLDPDYYASVDRSNPQRLMHALEVCHTTGGRYSDLRTGHIRQRPWRTIKIGLTRPREELYDRINQRVLRMMEEGLEQEVRSVIEYRDCNSLATVGYREMIAYIDGQTDRDEAIRLIQQNSRHYAKRQMTWWRRDPDIRPLDASLPTEQLITLIDNIIRS